MCPIPKPPVREPYCLVLSNPAGFSKSYKEMDEDITDDASGPTPVYTTAFAKKGLWVVHEGKRYNDANPDGKFVIVEQGQTVDLKFEPRSVRRLVDDTRSTSVFEHKNFGGWMFYTAVDQQELISGQRKLPAGVEAGLSSIFIPSVGANNWRFYIGGPRYTEPGITLGPGRYLNPGDFGGLDNAIESFKRV